MIAFIAKFFCCYVVGTKIQILTVSFSHPFNPKIQRLRRRGGRRSLVNLYTSNSNGNSIVYSETLLSEGGITGILDIFASREVVLSRGDCDVVLAGLD